MKVFVGFTVEIDSSAYREVFEVDRKDIVQDIKRRVREDFVQMCADQGIDCEVLGVK